MSDATDAAETGPTELELWQLDLRYRALRIRDRKAQRQLTASLLEHGQRTPLIVVAGEQSEHYVLIDGYGRVAAFRSLGRDTAQALLLPMSEAQALLVSYRLETGRGRSVLEEGWLVRELVETHELGLDAIAIELGHSKSWVSRRLGLVRELPESVQQLVRTGGLSAHTAMSVLVPLSRGNAAAVEQIADVVAREALSSRQTATLCRAWCAADDEQREQLLARPVEYLKIQQAVESESPRRRTPAEQPKLVRDFEVLASVSRRAEGALRGYPTDGRAELGETEALIVAWPRAREAFSALTRQVEARLDAGPRDEDGNLTTEP